MALKSYPSKILPNRKSGFLMVELMIAIGIFTIGVLGFLSTFFVTHRAGSDVAIRDKVRVALESVSELLRNSDFETLYQNFDKKRIEIPDVQGPGGGPAQVRIRCYINEHAIPAAFGPVFDLDGDGVLETSNVSTSYKLLPVHLRIHYATSYGNEVREVYLVLQEIRKALSTG